MVEVAGWKAVKAELEREVRALTPRRYWFWGTCPEAEDKHNLSW